MQSVPRQGSCIPFRIKRKAVLRIQIRSQAGTRASATRSESRFLFGLVQAGLVDDYPPRKHAGKRLVFVQNLGYQSPPPESRSGRADGHAADRVAASNP